MLAEICILLAAVYLYRKFFGSNRRLKVGNGQTRLISPPGPFQWPFIGNLPQVSLANSKFPHLAFAKLAKTYGDVMSVKFGIHNTIVLSSYEAIRDLLGTNEFAGRYDGFHQTTDRSFNTTMGIIFTSGEKWRTLRRYTMRVLRDFGFAKRNSMAAAMSEEVLDFCGEFESNAKTRDGLVTIEPELFALSFLNIVWSYVAGDRFSHTDERLRNILHLNDEVVRQFDHAGLMTPFPFLRYWIPGPLNLKNQLKVYNGIHVFMKELINEAQTTYEKESGGNPRTFIECFLQEIHDSKGSPDSYFNAEELNLVLQDLFLGGSETSSNTSAWTILYMMLHPDVQENVYTEIKQVSEDSNYNSDTDLLSLNDISRMPYTEATIQEIFRLSQVVPSPVARKTMTDYVYRNFFFPKGTCIFFNVSAVMMDKEYWGDPEVFRPERFLDTTGTKVINTERVIPFGYGKRVCMAETMARESFFMFFTGLVKKYKFTIPPGTSPPSTDPMPGHFTLRPYPYDVLVSARA